jgi:hypothetical protein
MEDITAAYARELQSAISGIEIRTPEHPADRAQRHRIEAMAVWIIAATSAFTADDLGLIARWQASLFQFLV